MDFLDFYKGKKVLVTGHTGFKGGWLTIWLNMLGAEVTGVALEPISENGIFRKTGIAKNITDYRIDIRNLSALLKVFQLEKPEIVFHLAAQPLVLTSYREPVDTIEVNVMGTINVLESIRQCNSVKAGVMITTDKCYENREWIWGYRENEAMGGHDPYSASKGAAEILINSFRKSFFSGKNNAAIASARAGNVIGGGDWSENRLVPDIIKSLNNHSVIEIRNPQAVRPWQYVLEPLYGYLKLGYMLSIEPDKYAEPWNFGPYTHDIHSVKDVVEQVISYYGRGTWLDLSDPSNHHEATLLLLDITKSIIKLNWQPLLSFKESIKLTVDWYKESSDGNLLSYSRNQIQEYQAKWFLKNTQ